MLSSWVIEQIEADSVSSPASLRHIQLHQAVRDIVINQASKVAGGICNISPILDADRPKAASLSVRWLQSRETC
ncbi:hypothetical protein V6N13_043337 [Hibiscus sabdariffa]|uniref:Uncharacterized protein n=1 Tax=Hibiscus sabdariffa TaxID=183260 RepID=A0ABR2G1V8_9ROSI